MQENVCLKLWVKLGCSPRCTQMVPKWHLDGQVARTDFFNARAQRGAQKNFHFRRERRWVDSTCSEMQENVCLKLWVKLGCSPRCTQMPLRDLDSLPRMDMFWVSSSVVGSPEATLPWCGVCVFGGGGGQHCPSPITQMGVGPRSWRLVREEILQLSAPRRGVSAIFLGLRKRILTFNN